MKMNVVDIWAKIFELLSYISTFFLIRKLAPKLAGSYLSVGGWVLFNVLLAVSVLTLQRLGIVSSLILVVLIVYGALRVFELFIYQINVLMFDQYRAEKAGKTYELRSYRRLMILSIHNYIEIFFWFSSFYFYFNEYFNKPELLTTMIGSFYYSLVTMSTLGYGDIFPIKDGGYLLVIAHTGIGVFLTLMIIARFISLLPKPETMDIYEKEKANKQRKSDV